MAQVFDPDGASLRALEVVLVMYFDNLAERSNPKANGKGMASKMESPPDCRL
jgi:hypothetical protein